MTIKLYNMLDDKDNIEKTITNETVVTAVMVNTDIVNPQLKLSATYINKNYVYIPDFNRYYYVTKTDTLTAQHIVLSCHTDVLYTAYKKDNLLSNSCHVVRNQYQTNSDISTNDIILNAKQYTKTCNFGIKLNDDYYYILSVI